MRTLILGGTKFLGRHIADEALRRGHAVTLFNRGRTDPGLFPEAQHLRGDRDGDLAALEGRRFEIVIDTSGYVPRVVAASARLLSGAAEHYTFVSSCSVYADHSVAGDEDAPTATLTESASEDVQRDYGALKALCEREVAKAFPDRAVQVRAGLIVGPYDPTNRFTYWVTRLAAGGDVLAPEPRDERVQVVDARDLAAWMLDMAEGRRSGTFNAAGPAAPLTRAMLFETIEATVRGGARLRWVPGEWLVDQGVEPWSELPLWLGTDPAYAGFSSRDASRAIAGGLRFRPLADTVRDTLAWARTAQVQPDAAGLAADRERELLRVRLGT